MIKKFIFGVLLFICFSASKIAMADPTSTFACRAVSDSSATQSVTLINEHTQQEFIAHRVWWVSIFWEDNLLPALMLMAEQLTTVAVKQTEIVGGFIDAKHQMETQQTLQKITARAHKDYHPSTGMCEFGSSIKSLAASERLGEANTIVLSQRSMDRGLGNANTAAAGGKSTDSESRLKQFREIYCNYKDNNSALDYMCEHDQDENTANSTPRNANIPDGIGGHHQLRLNKDIDYGRTIDFPWTLDVNLVDGADTPTAEEEDIFAMAANLYGRDVFARPQGEDLLQGNDPQSLTPMQQAYMDARAVLAKRSVAENSYNALVGMKASGTAGSRDFLEALLLELGVEDDSTDVRLHQGNASAATPPAYNTNDVSQLDALLGENPSYHAQMEVLTKKIFQNPDFYTNLYDKPANVERKGVAIQAIGLMQKFDLLKSNLRNEASQSVLLELAVIELQGEIEEELQKRTK